MDAKTAYSKLTANGKLFMASVGKREYDFFDDGIVEGSGNWGEHMAEQFAANHGLKARSVGGIMAATKKLGLWTMTTEEESHNGVSTWWDLTALGAEVALLAAAEAAPAKEEAAKVCKKDASHGEHRVTKTGSYCRACDKVAYEAQKAARAAAKNNG